MSSRQEEVEVDDQEQPEDVLPERPEPPKDETPSLVDGFTTDSRRHALTILKGDFPELHDELVEVLEGYELTYEDFYLGGGGLSRPASKLHDPLEERGWLK